MNEELRIAMNMAKYIKGVVIQYRNVNGSIYRGSVNYDGVNSVEGFIKRRNEMGSYVEDVKVIEDFRGSK